MSCPDDFSIILTPPEGSVACNKCGANRPLYQHPCPVCRCPEYRLSVEDRELVNGRERKAKKGGRP